MSRGSQNNLFCQAMLSVAFICLVSGPASALEIPLNVEEAAGYTRRSEPVSTGILLPRAAVKELSRLCVTGPDGAAVASQFETLATWPDGSVKWVLVDFFADCPSRGKVRYFLSDSGKQPESMPKLRLAESDDAVTVETGVMRCRVDRNIFDLYRLNSTFTGQRIQVFFQPKFSNQK